MTTHSLTWWEYDELVEHLADRPDLWTQSEENSYLWMRMTHSESIEPALGLHFTPPRDETSPYRLFAVEHGGVDQTPVKPGREFVALTTDVVYVEMRPQRVNVQFDDLMSKDGVPLDFDASIRYRITNSVQCVEKFGCDEGMIGRNLADPFRKFVRDAVKRRGMNETAIDASAAEAIDAEVTEATKAYVKTIGLPVELIDVTVGRANPPDAIKNQRVETATQEQRINTERQRKLAEDQRKDAEVSRAAADNAYREAMRLSPEQFLALESIHAQRDICAKGGCTFVAPGLSTSTVVGMR